MPSPRQLLCAQHLKLPLALCIKVLEVTRGQIPEDVLRWKLQLRFELQLRRRLRVCLIPLSWICEAKLRLVVQRCHLFGVISTCFTELLIFFHCFGAVTYCGEILWAKMMLSGFWKFTCCFCRMQKDVPWPGWEEHHHRPSSHGPRRCTWEGVWIFTKLPKIDIELETDFKFHA